MTKANSDEKIVKTTSDIDNGGLPMSLAEAAKLAGKKGAAPVHLWNPPFCGDLDMRIARDGTWYYLGSPIGRARLVQLFSSIIRKDDDAYFLVTPVEKVGIIVDDAPFVATDFDTQGSGEHQKLTFVTHVGDTVTAGPDHPIRVAIDTETGEPSPYVLVRDNLEALIDRKSFYRLVDITVPHDVNGSSQIGVWSSGSFFPFFAESEIV